MGFAAFFLVHLRQQTESVWTGAFGKVLAAGVHASVACVEAVSPRCISSQTVTLKMRIDCRRPTLGNARRN